jgi:oligoribonuclease
MAILAIDLETTGLDPHDGFILEVAYAVNHRLADIDVDHDIQSHVIANRDVRLNPFVARMHAASGLLDELLDVGPHPTLAVVEDLIVRHLSALGEGGHILAGNSVHFDHAWIRVHMPRLDRILSHRHIDATSDWLIDHEAGIPTEKLSGLTVHRARDDIAASIVQLQSAIVRRTT